MLRTQDMKRPRIVMVGGGSVNWTPRIVSDMMLTPSLKDAEYVLYDIRPAAARLTARFLGRLKAELGIDASIVPTDDPASAFKKADYVVITISTGGLAAMERDLAIPEDYGIYHTVGDTSGPGGWARAVRNFGVFVELAEWINRYAPGAVVLNYSNPMTVLTSVLAEICEGPVVGLCHGLFENLAFFVRHYRLAGEHVLSSRYSGLNHFFWMTEVRTGKRDLLKDLRRRIEKKSFGQLGQERATDEIGFWSHSELATELFRLTGIMPYMADRHTCEFLAPYIANKRRMKKYNLHRTSIAYRRTLYTRARNALREALKQDALPEGYRKRSRETAADIISAHGEGRAFIDVGNVPNVGQVPDLPLGTVVETPVLVDRSGFSPLPQDPLPEVVAGLLEPCAHAFNMTVRACFTGSRALALQALRLDPACSHLDNMQVTEMGLRLLRAHKRWIRCF